MARTCRHTRLNTWTWLGTLGPLGPPQIRCCDGNCQGGACKRSLYVVCECI